MILLASAMLSKHGPCCLYLSCDRQDAVDLADSWPLLDQLGRPRAMATEFPKNHAVDQSVGKPSRLEVSGLSDLCIQPPRASITISDHSTKDALTPAPLPQRAPLHRCHGSSECPLPHPTDAVGARAPSEVPAGLTGVQ